MEGHAHMKQIEVYLRHEWIERLEDDGMFDENLKPEEWEITLCNTQEFIEALSLEQCLTVDEIIDIIDKHGDGKDSEGMAFIKYINLVIHLAVLLLKVKKLEFESLINTACSVPADRITKFLKMLQRELMEKKHANEEENVVEKMQLKEIEYSLKNLNKR
jgi:hypothetical protein